MEQKNKKAGKTRPFTTRFDTLPVHPWSTAEAHFSGADYRARFILSSLQVVCRHLAGLAVLDELEADLLAVIEATHTSALNSRDVDENVLAAVVRLNEAEALCGVKPFYCASGHNDPFL